MLKRTAHNPKQESIPARRLPCPSPPPWHRCWGQTLPPALQAPAWPARHSIQAKQHVGVRGGAAGVTILVVVTARVGCDQLRQKLQMLLRHSPQFNLTFGAASQIPPQLSCWSLQQNCTGLPPHLVLLPLPETLLPAHTQWNRKHSSRTAAYCILSHMTSGTTIMLEAAACSNLPHAN